MSIEADDPGGPLKAADLPTADSVSAYDREAADFSDQYERLTFEAVHADILDLIPEPGATILDVGSGSGRDAAWLAGRGNTVVAGEPSGGMRAEAMRRHGSIGVRWLDDRLPGLERVHRLGTVFDFILVSAVWMHVTPSERRRAFRKLVTLLRPGGSLALTLRHGPADAGRAMHPVSRAEIEKLASEHGALVTRAVASPDRLGRPGISWETVVVKLADDGTDALPLIRQIVLRDNKSSTYKLALLRTVARAADASPGLAVADGDDAIIMPLGLVALYWVRTFLPLVANDLPQTPTSRNGDGLGFVKDGFRRLSGMAPVELRVGAEFYGDAAGAVAAVVRDAATLIAKMPAHFITYPGTERQVFEVTVRRAGKLTDRLVVDAPFLWSYGDFRIPVNLWNALTRLNVWIEPTLTAEWMRLMQRYLAGQGRTVPEGTLSGALTWLEPDRFTMDARRMAGRLFDAGEPIYCVWSGRRLGRNALDVDHCFPFAAWPNGDLWNLMPAAPRLNRHEKSDRLVSAELLDRSRDRIADWWRRAYVSPGEASSGRFAREAAASLPLSEAGGLPGIDEIFEGVAAKRLMLHVTQQLPIWSGP